MAEERNISPITIHMIYYYALLLCSCCWQLQATLIDIYQYEIQCFNARMTYAQDNPATAHVIAKM